MSKIAITLVPKSQKNEIVGWHGDELKIKIAAQPTDGEANRELVRFLAKELKITQAEVQIVSGSQNKHKILDLPESAVARLKTN